ncbi:MAG: PAS domain S-box protein, partial [Nitrospira defluvii]|nr:PAS domain S-box protein [Nitrospira defluvii]
HTVLVVDDEPDIVLGLQDFLDHEGYQVSVAGTCAEALSQAHEHQYNVVLLDLGLPDGDGSSVLRTLQELRPQLPVIILTAYTSADRTVGSLTQGAFAYLTKPYNRDELRAVLQRAVGLQALAAKAEHAEHALSESEERFRSLVEAATDSIVLADHNGSIISWNRAASRLFGYTNEEVRGRPLTMLMPLRHRAAHERGLARITETGQSRLIGRLVELEGLRKDGSEFPIELSLATWKTDDAVFYSGIIRDITQRRLAEEILDRLRHLHEVILTQAGEGIYGLDAAGLTTFVNPIAARLLEYEPSELLEQPMHARLHHSRPDGSPYPAEDCPIYAALHDGLVHRVATDVFWRKDGTSVPVEYVSTPIVEKGVVAVVVFRDITERKEAERAVEESQERFRQLAEHIKEVFWITDPTKHRMIYISPGYEAVWGRSCESLYASPQSWMEAIHPDDRHRIQDAAVNRQSLGAYDEEYRILRPDGSLRWIWDRAFPIRDTSGAIYRIVGFAEDITDYKQVQESLRASEERLKYVIRGSNDGFWDGHVLPGQPWHSPFTPVWWSPRVREMLGYSEAEFPDILESWTSRLHPEDRDRVFQRLAACLEASTSQYDVEYRLLTKQGEYRWFHARAEVVQRDEQGHAVRMAGSLQCITDRNRAEEQLRLSEERLRMALIASEVGILDWDVRSGHLYSSAGVEALFGLAAGSFLGTYDAYIDAMYLEDRGAVMASIDQSLRDQASVNIRHRVVWPDGALHWLAWTGRIYRDAEGIATRVLGIVHETKGPI